jgi:hypothetical protein
MQVQFTRWSLQYNDRKPVSINPLQVDATEHWCDAHAGNDVTEAMPAATTIVMKNKQKYLVQGTLAKVVKLLNEMELTAKGK